MKKHPKIILWVNSFFWWPHHDNGAFLFYGDQHVWINSERLDRMKQSNGLKYKISSSGSYIYHTFDRAEACIRYCLSEFKIIYTDVDVVVFLEGIPKYVKNLFPNAKIYGIYDHHLTHVFSWFYSSGFEDAVTIVVDGQGKRIQSKKDIMLTQSIYDCSQDSIACISETQRKEERKIGIGTMYEMVTQLLWFSSEGTTMGLSSYSECKNVLWYDLLQEYDNHIYANDSIIQGIEEAQLKFLGKEIFLTQLSLESSDLQEDKIPYGFSSDIASQLQNETEIAMIQIANHAYEKTWKKNLCITWWVGLNSVANQKILDNTSFENIYILPSTDDSWLAFWCALYGKKFIEGEKYSQKIYNFYFWKTYHEKEIEDILHKYKEYFLDIKKVKNITTATAKLLFEGNIIWWFQGWSESGPRALGNRSILADPRSIEVRDRVNSIKKREPWRPLAPSILSEYVSSYFSIHQKNSNSYKYMLLVLKANSRAKKAIPGVIHIDGTARIQEVIKEDNDIYHRLISDFHTLSWVPVLLNTSFNTKWEPIVESPEDAIKMFLSSELDYLILGDYIVSKSDIFSQFSFKKWLMLHDHLYSTWKEEISTYEQFLTQSDITYTKQGLHYEL